MAALSHSVRLETLGRVRFRGFTVMTYGTSWRDLSLRCCSHAGSWSYDHRTSCSSSCGDLGAAAFTDDRASKSLSPGGEALEGIAHQNVDACHDGHDQPSEHKFD